MSAFAAVNKRENDGSPASSYITPNVDPNNFSRPSNRGSYSQNLDNLIYTYDSVYVGLREAPRSDEQVKFTGSFEAIVLRGAFLVNGLHEINEGDALTMVVPETQSAPQFSSVVPTKKVENRETSGVLPRYPNVLQIRNLQTGLGAFGEYCPELKNMYSGADHYTFRVHFYETQRQPYGEVICPQNWSVLNSLTQAMCMPREYLVMVMGAKGCGKTTFAKTLVNNIANTGRKVAYVNLDPESAEYSIPKTLSVTLHTTPTFGRHFPTTNALGSEDLFVYYGFNSPNDSPDHYMSCCKQILEQCAKLLEQNIPVVVDTAAGVRGTGKDFVVQLAQQMNPSFLAYLSHNSVVDIGDFREDSSYEEQDNPDKEVIEGITCQKFGVLKGVRVSKKVAFTVPKAHNNLTYFHCEGPLKFNFEKHILFLAPLKLQFARGAKPSPESVRGIFTLGQSVETLSTEDVNRFSEATIMGLTLIPEKQIPKRLTKGGPKKVADMGPAIFQHSDYTATTPKFVCLCMVHSVDVPGGFFNVYVPQASEITESIAPFLEDGYRLAMVRGEGEIPSQELIMPQLLEKGKLPYVSVDAKMRVAGLWKPRKNLGRKNL